MYVHVACNQTILVVFTSLLKVYATSVFLLLLLLLLLRGKFGSPYLGKATAATKAALPTPITMWCTSVCPNSGMAASVSDF